MAGHSRSKNGVASLAYVPAMIVSPTRRNCHAVFNVPSRAAGFRNQSQRAVGHSRQGGSLRYGEENRARRAAAFPSVAGHVRSHPPDPGRDGWARRGSARLAGVEAPSYEDNETTIAQLKERIAKTVAFLKTLDRKQIDAAADREITFPLGGTNKGQMKGDDYLNHFMLPNFYFHCTAAYAILRHCGVDVGKRDFLGAIPLKMV